MRYVIEIYSDSLDPPLGASLVTSSPTHETCINIIIKESPNGNIKLYNKTMTNFVVLTINHHVAMCCPKRDNKSSITIPTKCLLVSNPFINYGDATNTKLPRHLSVQTKHDLTGSGKFKENITNNFCV
jgi:hypothetical protein